MSIRLIVGLGNPGAQYAQTRHNVGFWLLDNLAQSQLSCRLAPESRFLGLYAKTDIAGQVIYLLEPQTYMNFSGRAVFALAKFFKIAAQEILVVHDELDFRTGVIKLKKGGSSGGHNGLKSISGSLGTQDYWRLRIGIDHPRNSRPGQSVADYVLQRASRDEEELIFEAINRGLIILPKLLMGEFPAATKDLHSIKTDR